MLLGRVAHYLWLMPWQLLLLCLDLKNTLHCTGFDCRPRHGPSIFSLFRLFIRYAFLCLTRLDISRRNFSASWRTGFARTMSFQSLLWRNFFPASLQVRRLRLFYGIFLTILNINFNTYYDFISFVTFFKMLLLHAEVTSFSLSFLAQELLNNDGAAEGISKYADSAERVVSESNT